jgi:hypothetical protein
LSTWLGKSNCFATSVFRDMTYLVLFGIFLVPN